VIGAALGRLRRDGPETAARIPTVQRIIAFRNILVHGYDAVDNDVVWDVVETDLPELHRLVESMLAESG